MEKEFLTTNIRSVTLNVTGGKIDSFREKEETTGTVRVYENGCIGIAGSLGITNEDLLTEKAKAALSLEIPYPCLLGGALKKEELHDEEVISVAEFIPTMQSFLNRLEKACPRFAISNKISLTYCKNEYHNSLGRHLVCSGNKISIMLIVQDRGSGNLFDTACVYSGNRFDEEALLSQFKKEYDAFYTPVDIDPGRYPVIMSTMDFFEIFLQHFVAEMYVSGASLLSGKMGEKVFSDKLSLRNDMNPKTNAGVCFFDDEGCTAEEFRPTLIEHGKLAGLLTTKKSAEKFGLPNLGTAVASYDGVPSIGINQLFTDATANSLSELVPGKSIYVMVASGGDMTPSGHYATPVQMAYLMENGKIVGRLPELNISGDFFEILGKDYVGSVHGEPQPESVLCAAIMDVQK